MAYPISDVPRRIVYSGSAGVGPYAFTFEVLAATDLAVYKNATLLTLTTDYTVSINSGTGTGTITLVVAATGADSITIVGDRAIQRSSDFVTGGDLFANTLNDELDSLTIYAQQVDEKADRSLRAPVTDPTTINMILPKKSDRVGKYLSFDSLTGDPEVVNTVVDVSITAANISSINTVSGSIANVNTVATDLSGADTIGTVAGDISNVSAVGSNISNVNAVAGNATNINAVNANKTNIDTVAGNNANITTVAGVSNNVTTVASISSNVTTVANNNANVTTVAGSIASVNTNAGSIASINTNAANIVAIQNASSNAASAAASASAAAASAASAVNAPGTSGTSATSLTIGTGSKTFTTQTGKSWVVGQFVTISRTSAPSTSYMYGIITAYTGGTGSMTVDVTAIVGSGTYSDWTIGLSGLSGSVASVVAIIGGSINNTPIGNNTPSTGAFTTVTEASYPVVSQTDLGSAANEIPLNQYLGALAYEDTETPALDVGTGITTGTGTICRANGGPMGGIYRMTILIDLTGLNSGGTANDIIGVNGTALPCYIGRLPAMTVLGGRMTCLEAPAGGDTDIDLYSAAEGTGVEDQAVTALTETLIINAGTQTLGTVTYFAADPAANAYLYLAGQGTANATYTAGRFLIEIFGV